MVRKKTLPSPIIFDHVSYSIKKTLILDNLTFTLNEAKITGILGLNGSGKSSLLSLINGLKNPTMGRITILGKKLPKGQQELRKKIGVVLQETALYEELTTFENLSFVASLYNVPHAEKRIRDVLALLNLSDRAKQRVKTLSGGLRRRVAIARSLLHNPKLLVIDEPTLGVDVETRHAIWQHLRLLKSQGITVIVATNYLDEAQALCDTVVVLKQGTLLTIESPQTLVARSGYCLDIECTEKESKKLKKIVSQEDGVLRVDITSQGCSIFLKSDFAKEPFIRKLLNQVQIKGFRVRTPDLSEIFNTLEEKV